MNFFSKLQLIPLLQMIFTLTIIELFLNVDWLLSFTSIIVIVLVLVLINMALNYFLTEGKWNSLPVVIFSYLIYLVIFILFKLAIGDHSSGKSDNLGGGIIIIIGLIMNFFSLIMGSVIGVGAFHLRNRE
jgi:hypothetical protein